MENECQVEVVYASLEKQTLVSLTIGMGSTVQQAITQSGILLAFPMLDLAKNKVGIFSQLVTLDTIVKSGDRIEIYHPLLADPKQARRQRALKKT